MKLRRSRASRRGRIEIIPMIDVMFFLLATFMLASLTMQNLNSLPVDLPESRAQPLQPKQPVTLTVTRDARILLNETEVTLDTLGATIKSLAGGPSTDIIVSADNQAPSGIVVQAMLRARNAGYEHFLFAIKPE